MVAQPDETLSPSQNRLSLGFDQRKGSLPNRGNGDSLRRTEETAFFAPLRQRNDSRDN